MDNKYEHYSIICMADAPWNYPLWTNKQRIMSRLAKQGHQILYVDPPLGLAGWYKWWRQGRRTLRELFHWTYAPQENITVYTPVLFPPRYAWSRRLNELCRRRGIKRLMEKLGFSEIVIWAYHPDAIALLKGLPHRFLLYDCVDQYRAFPAYKHPARQAEIVNREDQLIAEADAVITTSRPLYEDKISANPHTYLVENVGDFANFNRAAKGEVEIPEEIRAVKRPRVGFVGALDSYKVDFEILDGIAEMRPEWSIVLVGPVAEGGEAGGAEKLIARKNVRILGSYPESVLPGIVRGFDAAIIPYVINDYTKYCFPLKVYEFLATGVPVVVSSLPALVELKGLIKEANTAEDFVYAIEDCLLCDTKEERAARINEASKHTYETRAGKILEIIRNLWKKE